MDPAKEGEEIENEAQQVKTEQPLNVANGVEKDAELPQKVESLDDIISNIKTVEVESEKLENQEATLLKEKIEKGREAIKPFEVAKEFIKKNQDVYRGEKYYGVLTGKEDAWLHSQEQYLNSNIAIAELDIQQLEAYYHETGEPLWGTSYGLSYKEVSANADKELEELKQKKKKDLLMKKNPILEIFRKEI